MLQAMNDDTKPFLIKLIAENKDNEACKYLWDQYYEVLIKFAVAYLKSKELAEEVVADVLYQVWSTKHHLENIQHLRVYLFTAVRNRCYTQLSKKKREQSLFVNTGELHEDSHIDFNVDPEKQMITGELSKFIKEIVEDLPPRCKQIYKLIREEGLRNKDVAVQLGISINTIDVQLAIALKKITKAMQFYYNR
ncbi:MAG TPA: RNA polymerase sigma-70 factor [Mucilaginibacter sp.]|nr:RNA polymerase sigma-70 factor [Mucilaginibacter sp.]